MPYLALAGSYWAWVQSLCKWDEKLASGWAFYGIGPLYSGVGYSLFGESSFKRIKDLDDGADFYANYIVAFLFT